MYQTETEMFTGSADVPPTALKATTREPGSAASLWALTVKCNLKAGTR
jgi:hypothetical protein